MEDGYILKDAQGNPMPSLEDFFIEKVAPTAFVGGTTNARGDDGGTNDPFTLFNVVGDVLVGVVGICTVDLTGSGTVAVGVTGNAGLFMAALAGTSIDANEVWLDGTPAIGKALDSLSFYIVGNGVDIIETIATDNITAGNIYYLAFWRPLTAGSYVKRAV